MFEFLIQHAIFILLFVTLLAGGILAPVSLHRSPLFHAIVAWLDFCLAVLFGVQYGRGISQVYGVVTSHTALEFAASPAALMVIAMALGTIHLGEIFRAKGR